MKLFLVAGEPSGDALGAALMAGLRDLAPGLSFAGVGGPGMQAQGLESLFPMEELSVMGLAEVLPRYPALRRRMIQTAEAALEARPAALITIDSPDFGLRVAGRVRKARPGLRTIHYVAPSVWAWRPGRATKMARVIDHVLALLPFEPPYMRAAGMSCDFVGHPIAATPPPDPAAIAAFRAAHGLGDAPVILALPGSRGGEVARLAPVLGATLDQVLARIPGARVVVPTVPGVAEAVRAHAARWPGAPVVVVAGEHPEATQRAAFACGRAALAVSGTVSLDLAAAGVPMVIAWDAHPLTWAVIRWLSRIDTPTLVNLVSETRSVPQCLGRACRPDCLVPPLLRLMEGGEERSAQLAAMSMCMDRLGRGGTAPGHRAAASVLSQMPG